MFFVLYNIYSYSKKNYSLLIKHNKSPMTPEENKIQNQLPHTSLYTWSNLEVQKVVNTYLTLHKIFFWLWIHLIIIAISIIIIRNTSAGDSSLSFPIRNNEIRNEEQNLVKRLSTIESKSYKENDIRVIIKQWPLSIENNILDTTNNLIVYKWYVTPKTIKLSINNELKLMNYFSSSWYDIRFLDMYMSNFILNTNRSQKIINTDNQLLPLQDNLINTFRIWCLFWSTVIDIFCKKAFDEVISEKSSILPLYELRQDYNWLIAISERVQWTQYSEAFCEAIKKYIFFSNDSGKEIKDIMVSCWKEYENSVADFSSFRSIQEQLSREAIWPTVTTSALLNVYKLISTQNEIYYDIIIWKNINTNRVNWYNNYVESLLKTPDSLQSFYFDVIARYNNSFLIPELTKASIQVRGEESDEYKRILEHLKKLNQWDSISRYKWLIDNITKKDLINVWNIVIESGSSSINIVDIFNKNYSFPNFIIKSTSWVDDKNIIVSWLLRFDDWWLANNTPMEIKLLYESQKFIAQSINLPRHTEIANIINKTVTSQKLSIGEVYNLILTNSNVKPNENVCEFFKKDKTMKSCTAKQVIFNRQGITYTFNYSINDGVDSYTISDVNTFNAIKSTYWEKITITKNSVDAIKLILDYIVKKDDNTTNIEPVWWAKEIQIQKDFNLIEASIKEISTNNNKTVVKFILKNYEYIAIYDTNNKNILGLWIIINNKTQVIRNFTFSFINSKPEEIDLFKNDPASFLLQKDPLTVKKLQLK